MRVWRAFNRWVINFSRSRCTINKIRYYFRSFQRMCLWWKFQLHFRSILFHWNDNCYRGGRTKYKCRLILWPRWDTKCWHILWNGMKYKNLNQLFVSNDSLHHFVLITFPFFSFSKKSICSLLTATPEIVTIIQSYNITLQDPFEFSQYSNTTEGNLMRHNALLNIFVDSYPNNRKRLVLMVNIESEILKFWIRYEIIIAYLFMIFSMFDRSKRYVRLRWIYCTEESSRVYIEWHSSEADWVNWSTELELSILYQFSFNFWHKSSIKGQLYIEFRENSITSENTNFCSEVWYIFWLKFTISFT